MLTNNLRTTIAPHGEQEEFAWSMQHPDCVWSQWLCFPVFQFSNDSVKPPIHYNSHSICLHCTKAEQIPTIGITETSSPLRSHSFSSNSIIISLSEPLPKTNDSLTKEVVAISVLVSPELRLLKQDLLLFSNKLQFVRDLKLKRIFSSSF